MAARSQLPESGVKGEGKGRGKAGKKREPGGSESRQEGGEGGGGRSH